MTILIPKRYNVFGGKLNRGLMVVEAGQLLCETRAHQKKMTKSVRLLGISITNLYSNNILDEKKFNIQLKFNL